MDDETKLRLIPMRTQVLMDDSSEEGVWVTVIEGWMDPGKTNDVLDESANLAEAVRAEQEGTG